MSGWCNSTDPKHLTTHKTLVLFLFFLLFFFLPYWHIAGRVWRQNQSLPSQLVHAKFCDPNYDRNANPMGCLDVCKPSVNQYPGCEVFTMPANCQLYKENCPGGWKQKALVELITYLSPSKLDTLFWFTFDKVLINSKVYQIHFDTLKSVK